MTTSIHISSTRTSTLSVLVDLLSVYALAYNGRHAEALSHRKDWFSTLYWPAYVVWWVSDDHVPTWEEAWGRLEHLNGNGPSPYAFDYSQTIDDDGRAVAPKYHPRPGEVGPQLRLLKLSRQC